VQSLAVLAILSFLPIVVVVATSFTKISVVLLIIRNAIGIQQTPPNLLVFAIALTLTGFVMAPVMQQTFNMALDPTVRLDNLADISSALQKLSGPLRDFMTAHSDDDSKDFFLDATKSVWPPGSNLAATRDDLFILVPGFLVSELTLAFKIGFLLYLPFLMIDFAVSAILIALGMTMMSPQTISTPLKLLLFVGVDGWRRLLEGLVLTYAHGG
jgi:type III secretion protein R